MSSSGVHDLIYPRQGEIVFWACIVEVDIIDAYSPFPLLFGDHHYIRQPIRILHFSNESGFQQFVNLVPNNFLPIRMEPPNLLPDGS